MKNILNNVTFLIHATVVPGVVELTKGKKEFEHSGIFSKFFFLLQEYLGFKYKVTTVTGFRLYSLVTRNKVHMTIPIIQTLKYSKLMGFSQALTVEGIKFFVGKPAELSKVTAIIRPFSIHVWMAIAISFIISLIIFSIIFRKDAKLKERKYVKVKDIAWALFGSFSTKGNDLFCPSGQCCKLLVSGWILATFIITSSYSGALMSFITFPGREPVPRTYSQLIKMAYDGIYKIGVPSNDDLKKYIANSAISKGENLKKLHELNKIEEIWLEGSMASRIAKEKFAYIFYENAIDIYIKIHGPEMFLVSEDQLFSINTGFGISKKNPYKKLINNAITRLYENGFLLKIRSEERLKAEEKRKSVQKVNSEIEENTDELRPLNVEDLAGPFLLLLTGYALSILIFVIEIIVYKLP